MLAALYACTKKSFLLRLASICVLLCSLVLVVGITPSSSVRKTVGEWKVRWESYQLDRIVAQATECQLLGENDAALGLLLTGVEYPSRTVHARYLSCFALASAVDYPGTALESYQQLANHHHLTPLQQADLAIIHLRLGDYERGKSQLQRLKQTLPSDKKLQRLISIAQDFPPLQLQNVQLGSHTFAKHTLLPLLDDLKQQSTSRQSLAEDIQKTFPTEQKRNQAEVKTLANWLLQQGFTELVTRYIPDKYALRKEELLGLKIDAYLSLKQHHAATTLLANCNQCIDPIIKSLLQAVVESHRSGVAPDQLTRLLQHTLAEAEKQNQVGAIAAVAALAQAHGLHQLAISAFDKQLAQGFITLDSLSRYLQASREADRSAYDTLKQLEKYWSLLPADSLEAQLTRSYLRIITGISLEAEESSLEHRTTDSINDNRKNFLAALLAHRMGNAEAVQHCLGNLSQAGWSNIESAIISHLKQPSAVDAPLTAALFPEEAKLLSQ
jgi:hypothetical protein